MVLGGDGGGLRGGCGGVLLSAGSGFGIHTLAESEWLEGKGASLVEDGEGFVGVLTQFD